MAIIDYTQTELIQSEIIGPGFSVGVSVGFGVR